MKTTLLLFFSLFYVHVYAQLTNISPDDLEQGDLFGFIVEISGDDLIINASSSNDGAEDGGAMYHYRLDGMEWVFNQKIALSTSELETSRRLGKWVTMSGDWIAAAIEETDNTSSVAFYKRENDQWVSHSKISNNVPESFYGWQIKLDGEQAIVSAIADFNSDGVETGAAYIYNYNSDSDAWEQKTKLTAPGLEFNDLFGGAVYIKDGLTVVTSRNDNDNGDASGAAFIYEKVQEDWVFTQKITPADGMPGDRFGYRISGDNDRLIISGYGSDNSRGAVYIYTKENEWVQEARLQAEDLSEGDWFGSSIAIEGNRILIGARNYSENVPNGGAVFVYEKENVDWVEKFKIVNTNGQEGDRLGGGVDFVGDDAVIGSYGYSEFTGAAYTVNIGDLVSTKEEYLTSVSLYPNPCEDHFVIDFGNISESQIEIFSIDGIIQNSIKQHGNYINVSDLAPGYYFARSKENSKWFQKFVKL